jgi:hypothetical protein
MVAKHIVLTAALMASIFFSALSHAHAQSKCLTLVCSTDQLTRVTVTPAQLNPEVFQRLQQKVEELATIWGDTILEGDYYADEKVQIDQITELSKNGALVGYYVTYSSQAWDTSTCEFDSDDLSTLESCESGRITEGGFISSDFRDISRDNTAVAEFKKGSR